MVCVTWLEQCVEWFQAACLVWLLSNAPVVPIVIVDARPKMKTTLKVLIVMATVMLFGSGVTHAAPVRIDYSGSVFNYFGLPIVEDDFPVGTSFSASVTFDEDFRSLNVSQLFLGLSRPVWGAMQLGASHYEFSEMQLTQYGYSGTSSNGVDMYGFRVLGTGPNTDDGEIFGGLFITIFPDSPSSNAFWVGFGDGTFFTATNGFALVTSFGSMQATELPPARVPEPASGVLVLVALASLAIVTRRRCRQVSLSLPLAGVR